MRTETGLVVLAAKESEASFWSIEPFVHVTGIQVIAVLSEEELFEGLRTRSLRPSVIMLSATLTEHAISETVFQIRELDGDVPVIVATSHSSRKLEREARCAGIFYYMTLPAHRDEVQQVTAWALRSGTKG